MLASSDLWWLALLLAFAVAVAAPFELARRRRLRVFWDRRCVGIQWRTRFPSASKDEIRRFLDAFVEAFGFPPARRLCFSPDDRVIDVYRTVYPSALTPDALEIDTFATILEERFHMDVALLPDRPYTLGELFALAQRQTI